MSEDTPLTQAEGPSNLELVIAGIWREHTDCTWVSSGVNVMWSCGLWHPGPIHMQPTTRDRHVAALVMTQVAVDLAAVHQRVDALVAMCPEPEATPHQCTTLFAAHDLPHLLAEGPAARTDPPPAPPELGEDEDQYPMVPEGWDFVLLGTDAVTGQTHPIAGVTADGVFVQWATTEEIVTVCRQALEEAMNR